MRLLVCGGRNFSDQRLFTEEIVKATDWVVSEGGTDGSWLPPRDLHIICGCAHGADSMAADWATVHWVNFTVFRADWGKHERAAGPIRNQRMIDEGKPDKVLAFPGGRGTADMVRRAKAAGIPVIEVPATA